MSGIPSSFTRALTPLAASDRYLTSVFVLTDGIDVRIKEIKRTIAADRRSSFADLRGKKVVVLGTGSYAGATVAVAGALG